MLRKQKISCRAGLRKRLTESRRPLHLRHRRRGVSRLIEQIEHDEYFNNYEYLNEGAFLKTLGKTFSGFKDTWKKNKEAAEYDMAEEERRNQENKKRYDDIKGKTSFTFDKLKNVKSKPDAAFRKRVGQLNNKKGLNRFEKSFTKQKEADADFASKENSRRKNELQTIKELKQQMEDFKQKVKEYKDELRQEKKELMTKLRKQPKTIQKMFKELNTFNFTQI